MNIEQGLPSPPVGGLDVQRNVVTLSRATTGAASRPQHRSSAITSHTDQ
jgi:hypothetical protein